MGLLRHMPLPLFSDASEVPSRVLEASQFGPQRRRRVFLGRFPRPVPPPRRRRTLGECLRPGPQITVPHVQQYEIRRMGHRLIVGSDGIRMLDPSQPSLTITGGFWRGH